MSFQAASTHLSENILSFGFVDRQLFDDLFGAPWINVCTAVNGHELCPLPGAIIGLGTKKAHQQTLFWS
jgi:hypothetical protein